VSVEELAAALNRISAAAGPYLVGVWIGCVMVGGLYSYLLLRRARIDQERLRGQGACTGVQRREHSRTCVDQDQDVP
jgi:hypothetical protein